MSASFGSSGSPALAIQGLANRTSPHRGDRVTTSFLPTSSAESGNPISSPVLSSAESAQFRPAHGFAPPFALARLRADGSAASSRSTTTASQDRVLSYLYSVCRRYQSRRRLSVLCDGSVSVLPPVNQSSSTNPPSSVLPSTATPLSVSAVTDYSAQYHFNDALRAAVSASATSTTSFSTPRTTASRTPSVISGSSSPVWSAPPSSSYQPVRAAIGGSCSLVASHVSLPAHAGTADLMHLLPALERGRYSCERALLFDPAFDPIDAGEKREPPPPPKLQATESEWVALVQRMFGLGMLDFTTRPRAVNGVFGVPKDDGAATRLIIDARPANFLFKSPPPVKLPTPDVLARMRVPSKQPFFTAKADVDNFYHRLRCPEWLRPYFALPPVRACDVSPALSARFGADAMVYPMCTTLPMGWSHSVYVAQCAHERLLDRVTALRPCDRLGSVGFGGDYHLRDARVLHSVYIDDLTLFALDREQLERVQHQYIAVANANGLAIKPSKVCAPTCGPVDVLGLEVDGTQHTIALSVPKLEALCADTSALVDRFLQCDTRIADGVSGCARSVGVECTGMDIAHLIGRWTWAMLVNRPSLSVFSAVYRFIETAQERSFVLWPSAALELAVAVGVAPLLFVRLSAPDYPTFLATDASEYGQGVVAFTPLRPDTVLMPPRPYTHPPSPQSIFSSISSSTSHSTSSSLSSNSSSTAQVQERAYPVVGLQSDECVTGGRSDCAVGSPPYVHVEDVRWAPIVAARWQRAEHINVLELRALHTAVKWVISHPHSTGSRVSVLSDSTVVIGAVRKGRSSSRPLLRRLRALSAWVMGAGLQLDLDWVPTEFNPADEPSRRFQPSVNSCVDASDRLQQ